MKRRDISLAALLIGAIFLTTVAPTAQAACPDLNGVPQTVQGCIDLTTEAQLWAQATQAWALSANRRTEVFVYTASVNGWTATNLNTGATWASNTAVTPAVNLVGYGVVTVPAYANGVRGSVVAAADANQANVLGYVAGRATALDLYARDSSAAVIADAVSVAGFGSCFVLSGGCPPVVILVPPPPGTGTVPTPVTPTPPTIPPPLPPTPSTPTPPPLNLTPPTNPNVTPPPSPDFLLP